MAKEVKNMIDMRIAQKKKIKPFITAIIGPTSSGKSDIAVLLAETFGGEVVSADSRQVYRGLDIGTGKITKQEMRGVPHHLLDIASATRRFTASLYQKKARRAVSQILNRGNIPIVCGGTGFYVDTFLKGLSLPEVPPNRPLRQALEKKSTQELFEILCALDSRRAKTIDRKNPRRLVRAIEIATALGEVPPVTHAPAVPAPVLTIGIVIPDKKLKKNIHARLLKRVKLGMISEARRLHNNGLSWKRFDELGLEYRFLARYLQKKMRKQEMLTQLETAINQYAKRQKQWFKRDPSIVWVKNAKEAMRTVKKFVAC
ncbi:MAG: tRNA (adenosine(37)-N6)-dimethylallyltransferase MiaA [Parcubacteria group bacterium]|nr:tRNA (adenosine(37)-N6)-dimethylallyltransferase MiaA [Parcubacteria group bacterium]